MKNKQKGFILPFIITVGAILIIGGSLIYYKNNSDSIIPAFPLPNNASNMPTTSSVIVSDPAITVEQKKPTYYDIYRTKCNKSSCCMSSVNNAEFYGSLVYDKNSENVNCPPGYILDMDKCFDSYKFCSPAVN